MGRTLTNKIIHGDVLKVIKSIPDNYVDLVVTDPPYFLDKLDNNWDEEKVSDTRNQCVVTSLPAGMKFDKRQGLEFYNWFSKVSKEVLRVLKYGGFFFSFSSPRLYHRMACAVDDSGFEIRDMFAWLYTRNQPKAMSLNHFIDKLELNKTEKAGLKKKLNGWKTPQIKSCFEPIVMGQKPREGTYLENFRKHGVGLFNTTTRVGDNMFPSNTVTTQSISEVMDKFFLVEKPTRKEKGYYNDHKTVKPLSICEYLISLTTTEGAFVFDPFVGSGTTALAAKKLGRKYIGIDINKEYVELANRRLFGEANRKYVQSDFIGSPQQLSLA